MCQFYLKQVVRLLVLFAISTIVERAAAWQQHLPIAISTATPSTPTTTTFHPSRSIPAAMPPTRTLTRLAVFTKEKSSSTTTTTSTKNNKQQDDAIETTKKYGLEAGLFQSIRQEDGRGAETAKSLLKKYGIAYLATSIPLALISFILCYALVDAGVDVASLLNKIGIETSANNADGSSAAAAETAGTLAIAYAAHKAASPIRFPPTVILTPIMARLIGKEPEEEGEEETKEKES